MYNLLVANRGEIACRIMRTARLLGLRTTAVYSEADQNAMHVRMADQAFCLGPAPALQSYLNVPALIQAIRDSGADAVHPGYGFLSENAEFAEAVMAAGATWVGPSPEAIRIMGSKIEAKRRVVTAGTPIVPGYVGDDQSDSTLTAEALRIGFPLLIKASAGGGGKGMRVVASAEAFADALAGARREARNAFNDDRVLLEKYLTAPKHIEVQILADTHGNIVHLFERDCSVQRRHQKVIEEAPAPTVDTALRARLGAAAVAAARSVDYVGAGTVEFIAEDGEFYFMEMNTRLQVEHPVTEAITGLDLVEWQLRVAAGERLGFSQDDLKPQGHAVEVRVYAENPARRFLPSTGTLLRAEFPDNVRVDTGVATGDRVTTHYDPMIAKIIAHGRSRQEAVGRLRAALMQTRLCGLQHNVGYLIRALGAPDFASGHYTTGFADANHEALVVMDELPFLMAAAHVVSKGSEREDPWCSSDGFIPNLEDTVDVHLAVGEKRYALRLRGEIDCDGVRHAVNTLAADASTADFYLGGKRILAHVQREGVLLHVMTGGETLVVRDLGRDIDRFVVTGGGTGGIKAPLPGQVLELRVKVGDKVHAGDVLLIIEAMKMEHTIRAPADGQVQELHCAVGGRVEEGAALVTLA
ncbi:MAG: biotin carboxylase N-terminal domain-containing protein [Pseudomonadales bacterium]